MCCDLVGSVRSWQHWLWDTARKRNAFLLFSIVLRTLQLLITLEPLDWFKWDFQQNVPNEDFNQIENWNCHMCYFRLIPLDHITYTVKAVAIIRNFFMYRNGLTNLTETKISWLMMHHLNNKRNNLTLFWEIRWYTFNFSVDILCLHQVWNSAKL